ncbi:Alpha-1,2-mannosyltransferase MNN23 [Cercospora zeina]
MLAPPTRRQPICSLPRLGLAAVFTLFLVWCITRGDNSSAWRRLETQTQQQLGTPTWTDQELPPGATIEHGGETLPAVQPAIESSDVQNQQTPSKDETGPENSVEESATSVVKPYESAPIREDAHKLAYADEFLPHFQDVLKLPNVDLDTCRATCTWPDLDKVNFQFAGEGDGGWPGMDLSWTKAPPAQAHLDSERTKWQSHVQTGFMPWNEHSHRFNGRGIVIVGGKNIKKLVVVLRQLFLLRSQLPVEIHYWGNEMTDEKKKTLTDLMPTIAFNDLSADHNIFKSSYLAIPGKTNYQLKTAAMMNTRFAEPLLLDSDNVPVIAPDSLWESSEYLEYGTIFWPDIARTRPDNPIWSITNTQCRMDEYEQESGQLLVDKRKFWYHLQLSAFLNAPLVNAEGNFEAESPYFSLLLGDKDTFRFAWHALKTKYGKPSKFLTSVGTLAGPDKFYCGHSFLQYHPDGRPMFMHGGPLKTMVKQVMKWHREQNGGVYQVYKKSDYEEQHEKIIKVGIGFDSRSYDFPGKGTVEEGLVTFCTLLDDIEPKPLEELVPGFEQEFDYIGGYWPLEEE